MKITTVGIDLAKNVFQVHGVDERGKAVLRKQLRRDQVTAFFANLPPCLIGMEACGERSSLGAHAADARPHRAADGTAVRQALREDATRTTSPMPRRSARRSSRPNMRFVPIKSVEQQAVLSLHRVRQGFVKARTAQANQIRGLLGEFGLIMPQGIAHVAKRVPALLEDASNELPGIVPTADRALD